MSSGSRRMILRMIILVYLCGGDCFPETGPGGCGTKKCMFQNKCSVEMRFRRANFYRERRTDGHDVIVLQTKRNDIMFLIPTSRHLSCE